MRKKPSYAPVTFRDTYMRERKDFGQVKPFSVTFRSKTEYDRKRIKQADRKRFSLDDSLS